MQVQGKRQNIVGLHYLRAIATLLVVVNHAVDTASFEKYFGPGLLTSFFHGGAGEIDFFFMMSGLIMVTSATDAVTGRPRLSAGEFLKRRAQRIVPMLWVAVILFNLAFFCAYGWIDIAASLRTLTFWPVGDVVPFVAWTIRYEVMFYLVFSLCFLGQHWLRPLFFLWCAGSLLRALAGDGVTVDDGTLVGFLFSPYNIEFGIGIALGLLMRRWNWSMHLPFQLAIMIAFAILLRMFVRYFDLHPGSLEMILSIAPFCIAMMLIAVHTTPRSVSRVTMLLGDASYSIFLLHPVFMSPVLIALTKVTPEISSAIAAAIATIIAVALSCVAHIWIERPLAALDWSKLARFPQRRSA